MADDNSEWILWAGLAGAVLLIASPIGGVLNSFSNAVSTPSATTTIANLPAAQNPYASGFGPAQAQNMPNLLALVNQYNQQAQTGMLQDSPGLFTGTGNLQADGDAIFNSYGLINTDYNTVNTSLFDMNSQYSVSLLNMYITFKYKIDLFVLLTNGTSFLDLSGIIPNAMIPGLSAWSQRLSTLPIFPPSFPMN